MEDYFEFVSRELLAKLNQIRDLIKNKHPQTIGILTEEMLKDFLRVKLPKMVSVEQGFIRNVSGDLSKQCDVLIYNSQLYAPFYRLKDIVIVPSESVIAVIEIKTSINKQIFHGVFEYFENISTFTNAKKYLFLYNSESIAKINSYFQSYVHKDDRATFDQDTYQLLPDEITGINESYHLKKDYVISERDSLGYSSYFYENQKGTAINALYFFCNSIHQTISTYLESTFNLSLSNENKLNSQSESSRMSFSKYKAIELFDM